MTQEQIDQLALLLAEAIEYANDLHKPQALISRLTAALNVLRQVTAP